MTDIRDDVVSGPDTGHDLHVKAAVQETEAVPETEVARETAAPGASLLSSEVASWLERMSTGGDLVPLADVETAELCDLLTQLELVKNATSAAQARVTVLAEARLRERAIEQGEPEDKASKGIARELALARRESPHAGSRHLGFSRAVVTEMPTVHAALTAGLIGEWTATQVVKETACLSVEQRAAVDAHLAGRLGADSHRAVVAAAKAKAYELDPYAATARGRKAKKDRRVSVRPAPDVMSIVSGYLPVAQGVACFKALDLAAKSAKAAGDERTMDQLRADIFIERLTGRSAAEGVDIEVGLVMTDTALLGLDETPARLEGYGPLPAPMARDLLRQALQDDLPAAGPQATADAGHDTEVPGAPDAGDNAEPDSRSATSDDRRSEAPPGGTDHSGGGLARQAVVWLRRLYTDRTTGTLVSQDDRRRRFSEPIRRFLVARDQVCRTPWCDAPVRHADHVLPWARGGRTTAEEVEGMCEACNYAKEAEGWDHKVVDLPDGSHTVKITTPTGHTYYSQAPPVLPTLETRGSSLPKAFGAQGSSLSAVLGARGSSLLAAFGTRGSSLPTSSSAAPDQDVRAGRPSAGTQRHRSDDRSVGRASGMSRGDRRVVTLRLGADQQPGAHASQPASQAPHPSTYARQPATYAPRLATGTVRTRPGPRRPAGGRGFVTRRQLGDRGCVRPATEDELSPLEQMLVQRLVAAA